jgi:hypothetical protein
MVSAEWLETGDRPIILVILGIYENTPSVDHPNLAEDGRF